MIDNGPEGVLYYRKDRTGANGAIPYLREKQGSKYRLRSLAKADKRYIHRLRRKTYALHVLPAVKERKRILKSAASYTPIPGCVRDYGGDEFRQCREECFGSEPHNEYFESLSERQNPEYKDELKVQTAQGLFRSKNEALFAKLLDDLALRSKYETPLEIDYITYYPDFAVLHPNTGQLIYIEFCGKLDDPLYRRRLARKIINYAQAGIYLGINFFIFAEHPTDGLDMVSIERMLRAIFDL
jgi:hypothetical protein